MKHSIPIEKAGPHGAAMAGAVQACVHCGFCLPTCPTYAVMGEEMDSPRGRITIMKQVLEGTLPLESALPHVDACLGCLACETSCPSGVQYRELISPFRAWAEPQRKRTRMDRLRRWMLMRVLPSRRSFGFAVRLGRMARPLRRLLPKSLGPMFDLLPKKLPPSITLRERYEAHGERRARVALLAGCAQQVLAPQINAATIRVLQAQGVEVIVPRGQQCCGALALHVGDEAKAIASARANLTAFPGNVDAILTNPAGCGTALREYPLILGDEAKAFAGRVQDVSEFLVKLGFRAPTTEHRITVAMQDACHLLHGQRVQSAPRQLLASIPGVEVREIADPELCCGSAGTYNLDQPAIAAELGQRKAANVLATQAEVCVTGNIGCLMQLRLHLGERMRVEHTMVLLDKLMGDGE
jgi:glycolate oxidase iron-sulfur subunit